MKKNFAVKISTPFGELGNDIPRFLADHLTKTKEFNDKQFVFDVAFSRTFGATLTIQKIYRDTTEEQARINMKKLITRLFGDTYWHKVPWTHPVIEEEGVFNDSRRDG